jgi:hypothetical protein
MTLTHEEFLRRFLQHVLPKGFPRIRYFGFLANCRRSRLLPLCGALLSRSLPDRGLAAKHAASSSEPAVWRCPRCQGPMHVLERLTALQISYEENRQVCVVDTS